MRIGRSSRGLNGHDGRSASAASMNERPECGRPSIHPFDAGDERRHARPSSGETPTASHPGTRPLEGQHWVEDLRDMRPASSADSANGPGPGRSGDPKPIACATMMTLHIRSQASVRRRRPPAQRPRAQRDATRRCRRLATATAQVRGRHPPVRRRRDGRGLPSCRPTRRGGTDGSDPMGTTHLIARDPAIVVAGSPASPSR
jgi:hypothetical protein